MCHYKTSCCCNVGLGSMIIATISFTLSAIPFVSSIVGVIQLDPLDVDVKPILNIIQFDVQDIRPYLIPSLWAIMASSLVCMLLDALLLYGIVKKSPRCFLPWLIIGMICFVIFTIGSLIYCFGQFFMPELVVDPLVVSVPWLVALQILILVVLNVLFYYSWDVVRAAYKQMNEENKGYLQKPYFDHNAYPINVGAYQKPMNAPPLYYQA